MPLAKSCRSKGSNTRYVYLHYHRCQARAVGKQKLAIQNKITKYLEFLPLKASHLPKVNNNFLGHSLHP